MVSKDSEHKDDHSSKHGVDASLPAASDIRALAQSMSDLSTSLNRFVLFLEENPELKDIPESLRELTKRISVLSTRL